MKRTATAWALAALCCAGGCGRGDGPVLEGKARSEWIKDLEDRDEVVRLRAVQVFAAAPQEAGPAVGRLVACLGDKDKGVRHGAFITIERIGAAAGPELEKAVDSENDRLRGPAAVMMVRIDPERKGLVKILMRAARDESVDVRRAASAALTKVGSTGIDELIESAKSKDVGERQAAVVALGALGSRATKAVPVLEEISASDTEELRRYARSAVTLIRKK